MTDVEEATYEDFIASRRTGRRNAIQHIPETPGAQGPSDLSQGLAKLSISKSGQWTNHHWKKRIAGWSSLALCYSQ